MSVLILIVAIIALVLYLQNRRSDGAAVPAAPGGSVLDFPKPETGSPIDAALRRLGNLDAPLCMLVGEPGSGRTSLMAGANLRLPHGPPSREQQESGGWGVWVFDQGLVLDMPGLSQAHGATWQAILQRLRGLRARRPIDGVLLAVPATDLTGPTALDATQLERKAQGLSNALQGLRRTLGVRFPIHVVITRGDVIPGFTGFYRTLPPRMRDEMLGWSSPYSPQEPYASGWVDEAFHDIHEALGLMQLELFADGRGEPSAREAAFLFPNELRSLAEPLRRMLDGIFRPMLSVEPLLLRGIYVSGDPDADGAVALGRGRTSAVRTPAFVTHLLERKVFPESGLAVADAGVVHGNPKKKLSPMKAAAIAVGALLFLLFAIGSAGEDEGETTTTDSAPSQEASAPAQADPAPQKPKTARASRPEATQASKPEAAPADEARASQPKRWKKDAPPPEAYPAY